MSEVAHSRLEGPPERKKDLVQNIPLHELFALDPDNSIDRIMGDRLNVTPPPPQQERFKIARAHREHHTTPVIEKSHVHAYADAEGYRKVLSRWPMEAQAQMYDRVAHGEPIGSPTGFSPEAFEAWKKFVASDWLTGMSPLERARLEQRALLSRSMHARQTAIDKELRSLATKLEKFSGPMGRVKRAVSGVTGRSEVANNFEFSKREYRDAMIEARSLQVLDTVVNESDLADAELRRVGHKTGGESTAVEATRHTFDIPQPNGANLHSAVLLRMVGHVGEGKGIFARTIPAVGDSVITELERRALPGGYKVSKPQTLDQLLIRATRTDRHGDQRVQLQTYVLELRRAISVSLANLLADGYTVKEAVLEEPLRSYVKSYEQTRARIEAGEESQALEINDMLETQIGQAERELLLRGSITPERDGLSRLGSKWIRALLEGAGVGELHRGHIPTAHIESAEHIAHEQTTEKYTVGLGESPLIVMQHFMRTLFPHSSPAEHGRMAQRFLSEGNVHDSDGYILGHFMRDGRFTGSLFATDVVHAIPDQDAPFGFKLEIKRGAGTQSDYYFENDRHGNPQWCYVKSSRDAVEVWSFDDEGRSHLAGTYEARKFVPYTESNWDYRSGDGTQQTITEFQKGVMFTQKGTVLSVPRNARSYSELGMNSLGSIRGGFPPKISVLRGGKTIEMDISNGSYLIAPDKTLFVLDKTFGMMPVGTIES